MLHACLPSAQELLKKRQSLVDNLVKLLGLYIPPLDNIPLKRGGDAVCAWYVANLNSKKKKNTKRLLMPSRLFISFL
jgi:hypothetical protein